MHTLRYISPSDPLTAVETTKAAGMIISALECCLHLLFFTANLLREIEKAKGMNVHGHKAEHSCKCFYCPTILLKWCTVSGSSDKLLRFYPHYHQYLYASLI